MLFRFGSFIYVYVCVCGRLKFRSSMKLLKSIQFIYFCCLDHHVTWSSTLIIFSNWWLLSLFGSRRKLKLKPYRSSMWLIIRSKKPNCFPVFVCKKYRNGTFFLVLLSFFVCLFTFNSDQLSIDLIDQFVWSTFLHLIIQNVCCFFLFFLNWLWNSSVLPITIEI